MFIFSGLIVLRTEFNLLRVPSTLGGSAVLMCVWNRYTRDVFQVSGFQDRSHAVFQVRHLCSGCVEFHNPGAVFTGLVL